jgi:hypothetical protein
MSTSDYGPIQTLDVDLGSALRQCPLMRQPVHATRHYAWMVWLVAFVRDTAVFSTDHANLLPKTTTIAAHYWVVVL